LLGVNLNGGDDNSSRDSSTTGDREPGESGKRKSGHFGDSDDFDVRSSKRLRYLDGDELEMRRRVSFQSYFNII
jgi:hypothetical protein